MLPEMHERYCLVMSTSDADAQSRLSQRARSTLDLAGFGRDFGGPLYAFAAYGCERSVESFRIILESVIRLENGGFAVRAGGDYLPNYPPGIAGHS